MDVIGIINRDRPFWLIDRLHIQEIVLSVYLYLLSSDLFHLFVAFLIYRIIIIFKKEMNINEQLHLSSVIQISSPWKEKSMSTYISKIIKLQNDESAIILTQDNSKPLRFLYLSLFMSKHNSHNIWTLLSKINHIKESKSKIKFVNMTPQMAKLVGNSMQNIHKELAQFQKRLQNSNYSNNMILKLTHEFLLIDPLLILSLRAIADEYNMTHALNCSSMLSYTQIQILMNKFIVDKDSLIHNRNKYVIFWNLTEMQVEFFRARGVVISKQSESYDELCDSTTLKYQEYLMIQKVFSLL